MNNILDVERIFANKTTYGLNAEQVERVKAAFPTINLEYSSIGEDTRFEKFIMGTHNNWKHTLNSLHGKIMDTSNLEHLALQKIFTHL